MQLLPITLPLRSSRRLAAALLLAHALAAAGLVPTDLPLAVKLLLWLGLGLSLALTLRHGNAVATLTLKADGRIGIDGKDAAVHPQTTVFPRLIVLLAKTGNGTKTWVLPVDALGREGHRQLRLWLKWKASAASA
ncbi:MAG: hypothetical protein Q8O34_10005 [Rhodocyclaceae bacterium]|nr:hypothetical protein [Rhodocyclaceae bacterium]